MIHPRTIASGWLLLAAIATTPAQQELGLGKMWTFENPPLAYLEQEYGFKPTQSWLDALRLASIRFGNGCSSSFVSPKGLIMTNHHCIRDHVAETQGENDWLAEGFYAKALTDEVKLDGLTVQQLVAMKDVTAEVLGDIAEDDDDATVAKKRELNSGRVIEAAKAADDSLSYQVVELYQGAVFQLYAYRVFDDVRLVCVPHLQSAYFGGDFDNFTYPRYCLDFAFARAYVDGEPADTASHYFAWSARGAKPGELVFVTGNPGTTKRLLTHAQMEFMRDTWHPIVNELIDGRLLARRQLAQDRPELARELETEILSWENTQKAYRGYLAGLQDDSLMAQKAAAEREFIARIEADPELKRRYGGAFAQLARVAAERGKTEARRRFYSHAGHPALRIAGRIATAVLGGETAELTDEQLAYRELDPLGRADFVDHLERATHWLPADDPYLAAVLAGKTPADATAALDRSELRNLDYAKSLRDGGEQALRDAIDPAVRAALAFVPAARELAQADEQLTAIETAQGGRIGQALHAVFGSDVSPDATFTLRFSDGVVRGYPFNGTIAPPKTTLFGLYARYREFDGQRPFDLPQAWLDREDRLDLATPVNMVSTNDIIGGNSGSPLVNQHLEVVGLVFDGNIEMLPNRYVYRGEVARTVSVTSEGIVEALAKVYDADRLVTELRPNGN